MNQDLVTTHAIPESFAIFHPTPNCKISGLGHVEPGEIHKCSINTSVGNTPVVEARVIGMRKDDDH